jgi:hypothetical protein
MPARDPITDRLDAALEKVRCQQLSVRIICLTTNDLKALDRINTKAFGVRGCKIHTCDYAGHPVRVGPRSVIYSTHGYEIAVPYRLSAKVAAA